MSDCSGCIIRDIGCRDVYKKTLTTTMIASYCQYLRHFVVCPFATRPDGAQGWLH